MEIKPKYNSKEELEFAAAEFQVERAYTRVSGFFGTQEGLEQAMKEAEKDLCPAKAFPTLPAQFRVEFKDKASVETFMTLKRVNKEAKCFNAIYTYLMALKDLQWAFNRLHGYYRKEDWKDE